MAITVHLGGQLGTLFKSEWIGMNVLTPAEAIRAIDVNTKGAFLRYLSSDRAAEYHICVSKEAEETCLSSEELKGRIGNNDIYILPAIKGKNSGWAKIVAGVILIIVGVLLYAYGGQAGVTAGLTLLQTIGVGAVGIGASLVLGGITQLLVGTPQTVQQYASYSFQGNASTANQGACVPIFYGRYLVTPVPICVSFSAQNTQNFSGTVNRGAGSIGMGNVDDTPLPGGGIQYSPGGGGQYRTPGIPPGTLTSF